MLAEVVLSILVQRLVFSLPGASAEELIPDKVVPKHLAYVEWFKAGPGNSAPTRLLPRVRPAVWGDDTRKASIIPLDFIQRSVHLIPKFGPVTDVTWSWTNALTVCDDFYVSEYSDLHLFYICRKLSS